MSKKETKVKRTDYELTQAHKEKVERYAENVAKWVGKLAKAMKSKKYPMTEEHTAQVLDYLQATSQAFADTISASESKPKPGFKLK